MWCHSHRLALVITQAVSCDSNSVDLFGNLETLYNLFWCAKKRAAMFREWQQKISKTMQVHAVKRVNTTRWSSYSAALNVFLKCHEAVLNTLNDILKNESSLDATVGSTCSGLIIYFSSYRFLLIAFKRLFDILGPGSFKLEVLIF